MVAGGPRDAKSPAAGGRIPRVAVVGAGMSGLLMGIRLKQAGIARFDIYEKAGAVGGTWRDNSYPGLSCDVPAYTYTYSFEPNPGWSHRYARGSEIRDYFEAIPDKHGIRDHIRFNQELVRAERRNGEWILTARDGQVHQADILITATGVLHHPRYPDIPGLESFAGPRFHTARWDHSVALEGRRVGVIGSGSTAVQITCALAGKAAHYSLFQRTPQWVMRQWDTRYSATRRAIMRRLPVLSRWCALGLGKLFEMTFTRAVVGDRFMLRIIQDQCRRHLASVKDPELRRQLTPDYEPACRRLIFSDDFYRAIQHPDVELVTAGIERVEPRGIVTRDGRLHELDVLVLATGFHAHHYMRPMKVIGDGGLDLDEVWSGGAQAYRTVAVPGFQNFFMLIGPHSPIGNYSLISIAELQASYIMEFVRLYREGKASVFEPRAQASEAFNAAMREQMKHTVWTSGCTSWYLDASGFPALWPWTFARFRREMAHPELDAYELRA